MSKTFRPYDPDQAFLMPASMRDWLPCSHLAYFLSDVVDQLDLSSIMKRYAGEERGFPPYHPRMMVKVLLVCLLCRSALFSKDSQEAGGRHRFSGVSRQQHS